MYLQKLALAAGLTVGVAMVSSAPAAAAPFYGAPALGQAAATQQDSLIVKVRHRGRRGRRGGSYHHGGISPGAAAAIGIFGAIGTMMAIDAARQQQERDAAIRYCMHRFRSYDPVSMTYLGFDGFRHPCP